eukprot:3932298-Amphidinium_carterae.1
MERPYPLQVQADKAQMSVNRGRSAAVMRVHQGMSIFLSNAVLRGTHVSNFQVGCKVSWPSSRTWEMDLVDS